MSSIQSITHVSSSRSFHPTILKFPIQPLLPIDQVIPQLAQRFVPVADCVFNRFVHFGVRVLVAVGLEDRVPLKERY